MRTFLIIVMLGAMPSWHALDAQTCSSAGECRQMAEEAAQRQDYEAFLALAWRAVQTGPRNDPNLLFLVARAQSLSGRPQDALIMLRRLADMKFAAVEAETSDDFRRVRALPAWPEVLQRIYAAAGRAPMPPVPQATAVPAPAAGSPREPATLPAPVSRSPTAPAPSARETTATPAPTAAKASEGLTVPAALRTPVSMAYDGISKRFVIADESSDTIKVVDELARNAVNLVKPRWAEPYQTTALTIDSRNGDLWITGAHADANGVARSAVYRLQLVSGRLLYTVPLLPEAGAARFVAVALAGPNLLTLDAHSRRIFELPPASKALRVKTVVEGSGDLTSLAAGDAEELYVSDAAGVLRLNPAARTSVRLTAAAGVNLGGLQWIAYYNDALIAIQRSDDGRLAAVRIRLNATRSTAVGLEVLGDAASRAASLANGTLYYVAQNADGTGMTLRRLALR